MTGVETGDRQAAAVDRDAVAEGDVGRDQPGRDLQRPRLRRRANATTWPASSMIPVNMGNESDGSAAAVNLALKPEKSGGDSV
ncbi:MAG: hypothetical protein WDM96_12220 [Lacunisphaera sp.]